MPYDTPSIDSPADLFALAATRADEYIDEMDLEPDFDSRFLTSRYLIETVSALYDIARGRLDDDSTGLAYNTDRLDQASLLLHMLDSDHHARVQNRGTTLVEAHTLLIEGLHVAILDDYYRD